MIIEMDDGWTDRSDEGPVDTLLYKGDYSICRSLGGREYRISTTGPATERELGTTMSLEVAKAIVDALCKAEEPVPVADPAVPAEQFEYRSVVLWPGQRVDAYSELNTLGATGFQVIHAYVMGDQGHHFIMQRRKPQGSEHAKD